MDTNVSKRLKRLEGLIDIYLPDLKYCEDRPARKLSGAPKYWEIATRALAEMQRQVGELQLDEEGVAVKGLLVRHLVLPGRVVRHEKSAVLSCRQFGQTNLCKSDVPVFSGT